MNEATAIRNPLLIGPTVSTLPPDLSDRQVKHLEFIQNVIARLSTDSFLMKGWAVTVAGLIYGFSADHRSWPVGLVGLMPVTAFWFLDVYFVRKERQFRQLYDEVRESRPAIPQFSMDVGLVQKKPSHDWGRVARSVTIWPFYGFLVLVGLLLVITGAVTGHHHSRPAHASRTTSATSSFTLSGQGSPGGQMFPM